MLAVFLLGPIVETMDFQSKEAVDMIQELIPTIPREAAWKQMNRYVKPINHKIGVLKLTTQKIQANTKTQRERT